MKRLFIEFAILTGCMSLFSCKEVEYTRTDTIYATRTEYVQNYIHDSVWNDRWHTIEVKGDSVFLHDSVFLFRQIVIHDTTRQTDTLVKAGNTSQKEVIEKKVFNWWWMLGFGLICSITTAIVLWERRIS